VTAAEVRRRGLARLRTVTALGADLAALGDTVDEVAASLIAANITGLRCTAGQCPVSVYLSRKGYGRPQVGAYLAAVEGITEADRVSVTLPPAVIEFVRRFDAGDFPALQATPTGRPLPAPYHPETP
jgi:hypothetical protein